MKYKTFDHMNCSLAQTLNVIGDRWTLLILRDAFFGIKRFSQFTKNLGIAKNILTARLNFLVEEGMMERKESSETAHLEYVLTDAGRSLQPILLSMTHWGDVHRPHPDGDRIVFVERETGKPIRKMTVMSQDGKPLKFRDVKGTLGPGMK
jgi:DNA-binding HxlR family transcriptional regulator